MPSLTLENQDFKVTCFQVYTGSTKVRKIALIVVLLLSRAAIPHDAIDIFVCEVGKAKKRSSINRPLKMSGLLPPSLSLLIAIW